jgi:uncharacterized protein (TIGR02757 family)
MNNVEELLESALKKFKKKSFIDNDPICIPHEFQNKEDIEVSSFLTALISWGNRKSIIEAAKKLIKLMNHKPYEFILNFNEKRDFKKLENFYYRTFKSPDLKFIIQALSTFYQNNHSLEKIFINSKNIETGIINLRETLLKTPHLKRSEKHLPNILNGSAAKKINMFLRWMVRKDNIDFGIWKKLKPSELLIPLDVHTTYSAYTLKLIPTHKANWKNVLTLTNFLKKLDPYDPIKYDFALFELSRKKNFLL